METPRTSALGFTLLGLLSRQPSSGYDLRKLFATTPLGYYSDSPGSIYPALARLEESGLVEAVVDRSRPLRPRKVFAPTAKGRAKLKRWLNKPISREDIVRRVDELVLRFALMEGVLDRSEVIRFLQALETGLASYVAELEEYYAGVASSMPLYGRLSVEQGIENYKAHARWAKIALERVAGSKAHSPRRKKRRGK